MYQRFYFRRKTSSWLPYLMGATLLMVNILYCDEEGERDGDYFGGPRLNKTLNMPML
jgi:hypothetical protein